MVWGGWSAWEPPDERETVPRSWVSPNTLFPLNHICLLSWFLLLFFPRWRYTKTLTILPPVVLSVMHCILVLKILALEGFGLFTKIESFSGVMELFGNEWVALTMRTHLSIFDAMMGLWEVTNARKYGIPHYLVVPCLILTYFLGPTGLLVFMLIRSSVGRDMDDRLPDSPSPSLGVHHLDGPHIHSNAHPHTHAENTDSVSTKTSPNTSSNHIHVRQRSLATVSGHTQANGTGTAQSSAIDSPSYVQNGLSARGSFSNPSVTPAHPQAENRGAAAAAGWGREGDVT
ncbi:unnamed protein product [Vitrella brassicaformis CCMP3155]|uniref:Uncharacterized protein n=2 Tax=Vitrella brassicaformis TaxID=1169539 RepID=A0A0G4GMS5_VITBC|nr:unnamed protein product [Vitrella brassicaformis CCMP3155]|eukprot:CEM31493.1 unnamed protein product [Vitrella brassicaformis CCMP3155]